VTIRAVRREEIINPKLMRMPAKSHLSTNTRSGDISATGKGGDFLLRELTTEDTKRRIHKGHGGGRRRKIFRLYIVNFVQGLCALCGKKN